jgi:hypothetical protein
MFNPIPMPEHLASETVNKKVKVIIGEKLILYKKI